MVIRKTEKRKQKRIIMDKEREKERGRKEVRETREL